MSSRRKGSLERINLIFSDAIKKMGHGKEFLSHMLMFYWPRIVGVHNSKHVKPVKMEFKKLFLYADHPAWANQLSLMEGELIKKINSFMGEYMVEKIIFTQQKPEIYGENNSLPDMNIGKEINKVNIDDNELKIIEDGLSFIDDNDLKKVIYKVRINDEKYKKYRKINKWKKCKKCENLCPPEYALCSDCRREKKLLIKNSIRNLLIDMPWARYCDVVKDISCTADEVNEEKIILMQRLASKISSRDKESIDMNLLVMLYKSVPPEKITRELKNDTIKKFRYDFRK